MREIGTIGENGKSFLHFSYTLPFNLAMTRDSHSAGVPFITTVLVLPNTLRAYQNCFLPRNGK
jgi:hypothetical protein